MERKYLEAISVPQTCMHIRCYGMAVLCLCAVIISSCESPLGDYSPKNNEAALLSFVFEAEFNADLRNDIPGTIDETAITVFLPYGISRERLKPTVAVSEGAKLTSDKGEPAFNLSRDFTSVVNYTVHSEDESSTVVYSVVVTSANVKFKEGIVIGTAEPASYGEQGQVFSLGDIGNLFLFRIMKSDITGVEARISIGSVDGSKVFYPKTETPAPLIPQDAGIMDSSNSDIPNIYGVGIPAPNDPPNADDLVFSEITESKLNISIIVTSGTDTYASLSVLVDKASDSEIYSWNDLQAMSPTGEYEIMNHIIFPGSSTYGFTSYTPLGSTAEPFTGTLNGNEFSITNLYIEESDTDYVGLFGVIEAAEAATVAVKYLTFSYPSLQANAVAGVVAGYLKTGTVDNITIIANGNPDFANEQNSITVRTDNSVAIAELDAAVHAYAGGVVGVVGVEGTIDNSAVILSIMAEGGVSDDYVGILAGANYGMVYGKGDGKVMGDGVIGGLVGYNQGTVIGSSLAQVIQSSTTDNLASQGIGGLVGINNQGSVVGYTQTRIDGASVNTRIGGLVGENRAGTIYGYANGSIDVLGDAMGSVGGLVGSSAGGVIVGFVSVGDNAGSSFPGTVVSSTAGALVGTLDDATTLTGYWNNSGTEGITDAVSTSSTHTSILDQVFGISATTNMYIYSGEKESSGRTPGLLYDSGNGGSDSMDSEIFSFKDFVSVFELPTEDSAWPQLQEKFTVNKIEFDLSGSVYDDQP